MWWAGLLAVAVVRADTPAPKADAKPASGASSTTAATPGAKPGTAAPAKKKLEPPPAKIDGLTIERTAGGFLGLTLVGGNFRLGFYDAKKKPMTPDVDRAALRWPVHYRPADERTVLNLAGDGVSLSSEKIVKPPYNFKLFITLLKGDSSDDKPAETYSVDFRQE